MKRVPKPTQDDTLKAIDAFFDSVVLVKREDHKRWLARDKEDAEDERLWKEIDAKTPAQIDAELKARGYDHRATMIRLATSMLKGTDAVVLTKEQVAILDFNGDSAESEMLIRELRKRVGI